LEALRQALTQYRVCDPACGSGNFLYMGYNAVKDLEVSILRLIEERRTSAAKKAPSLSLYCWGPTSKSITSPGKLGESRVSPGLVTAVIVCWKNDSPVVTRRASALRKPPCIWPFNSKEASIVTIAFRSQ
ncbi:MAG: DNA methyltransferase, partial [Verrucomicrobiota bacterium]